MGVWACKRSKTSNIGACNRTKDTGHASWSKVPAMSSKHCHWNWTWRDEVVGWLNNPGSKTCSTTTRWPSAAACCMARANGAWSLVRRSRLSHTTCTPADMTQLETSSQPRAGSSRTETSRSVLAYDQRPRIGSCGNRPAPRWPPFPRTPNPHTRRPEPHLKARRPTPLASP